MKEYIEREAAIDNFMQYTWYDMDGSTIDDSDEKRSILKSMFASIPTADVRENVRGEWVEDDYGYIHCSHCGMEWEECEHPETNFCPNCGAKMKEAQEK